MVVVANEVKVVLEVVEGGGRGGDVGLPECGS